MEIHVHFWASILLSFAVTGAFNLLLMFTLDYYECLYLYDQSLSYMDIRFEQLFG